ncbi:LR75A protein, partial [Polyodon spathula]|nr:LR75A protein [Polyodon spathula]
MLQKKVSSGSVDLSGIPLSARDVHRVAYYLQNNRDGIAAVDLSFTELHDDHLLMLLPYLGALPKLTNLALNGNRLTLSIIKDLTEALKDVGKFPSLSWIDLGNNVDIFTMPQPLLVALRRRCSLRSSLPTIYEYTEGQVYDYTLETSIEEASHCGDEEEEEEDLDRWAMTEKSDSQSFTLQCCESLKTMLQKKVSSGSVDLSGIPLSARDVHRVAYYLQNNRDGIAAVDLSFTELHDDHLLMLLPYLGTLPKLTNLALNGNRLTLSIIKDLTEALKDVGKFPSLSWIDLGNNVDIFTMPQPLLVALRRRCSLRSSLPTIYEYTEGQVYDYTLETSIEEASHCGDEEEEEEDLDRWAMTEKSDSQSFTLQCCER